MNRYRFFWESLGRMARACSGMQSIAFPTNRTMTKLNQMLHRQLGGLFVVQNNSIDAIESGPSVSSTRGTHSLPHGAPKRLVCPGRTINQSAHLPL